MARRPRPHPALQRLAPQPVACAWQVVDQPAPRVDLARPQAVAGARQQDGAAGRQHPVQLALHGALLAGGHIFEHAVAGDQLELPVRERQPAGIGHVDEIDAIHAVALRVQLRQRHPVGRDVDGAHPRPQVGEQDGRGPHIAAELQHGQAFQPQRQMIEHQPQMVPLVIDITAHPRVARPQAHLPRLRFERQLLVLAGDGRPFRFEVSHGSSVRRPCAAVVHYTGAPARRFCGDAKGKCRSQPKVKAKAPTPASRKRISNVHSLTLADWRTSWYRRASVTMPLPCASVSEP